MKKKSKILLGLGIVLILLVAIFFNGNVLVLRKVDNLLKAQVRNALGDGWTFDYGKSKLKLSAGVLSIDNLYLSQGDGSETYWELDVSNIQLHGFQVAEYLSTGRLFIDSLSVDDPLFEGYRFAPKDTAKKQIKPKDDPMGLLYMKAKKIRTSGGNIFFDPQGPMVLKAGLEILLSNVVVDGSSVELVQMEKGKVLIPDIYFQFPDSIYALKVDSVEVLYGDTIFAGFGMHLESNLGKIAYGHHFGWKKARWTIEVPTWYLEAPKDIDTHRVHLSRLWLNDLDASIFKDGRLPFPDMVKKYPQEMLEALKMQLRLDEVIVRDARLIVEELHGERVQPARIELLDLNARLLGLQNENRNAPALVMAGSTKLQGQALVSLEAAYFYGDNNAYTLKGSMDPADLQIMRRFMEHSGNVSIKSGNLNSLTFDMKGNKDTTYGFVDFHYSNLEVELIKKETGDDMGGLVNFFTTALGGMFYHKDNPSGKYGYHRGVVGVQNKPYKAFVGHWVEGLLDGLLHSVLRSKTKKEDKAYRKEMKEAEKEKKKAESDGKDPDSEKKGLHLFKKNKKLELAE